MWRNSFQGAKIQVSYVPIRHSFILHFRYQETYDMVRQVVDENGGEIQYTDVAEFLVKQMLGKFHPTDLQLMQVNYISFGN